MKKDPSVAFYNDQPEAEMQGLDNKVDDLTIDDLVMKDQDLNLSSAKFEDIFKLKDDKK